MTEWKPNVSTKLIAQEFASELLANLPRMLGVDEIISGCELVSLDTFGTGVAVIPRYVTVKLRGYNQFVWYNGNVGLVLGDTYTVMHLRDGDRYELLGPSGTGGSSGGGYTPPTSTYERIVVDTTDTMEVVVSEGEIVWI